MDTEVSDERLGAQPGVLQLALPGAAALHQAYVPALQNGGVFVPTAREYRLGDEVCLLITLPGDAQQHPVRGRVAWITPARAPGNRTQGVGVHFPGDDESRRLKARIEAMLATFADTERPTQTF